MMPWLLLVMLAVVPALPEGRGQGSELTPLQILPT